MEYREFFKLIVDGDIEAIRSAIDSGYDINLPDQWGFLPVHRACANHQKEIVALLIERGSKVHTTATDNWTPLHLASISGAVNCLALLVERGANVNAEDKNGQTPLHLSITYRNPEFPAKSIELVKTLLALGSNKYAKNKKGFTPLDEAQKKGRDDLYQLLA